MKLRFLLIVFSLLIFSCDKEQDYDKTKAVSAFAIIDQISVDQSLKDVKINLPQQKNNIAWNGYLFDFENENLAKNFNLKKEGFFNKNLKISLQEKSKKWFFYRGSWKDSFIFSPIIRDNKIYIFDTASTLSAFDLKTEKRIWKNQVFHKKILKNYKTPKISFFNDRIFAIAGINKIAAISAKDGKTLWIKEISSIPNSTPISDGKLVYVSTNDNKTYALNFEDGNLSWVQSGVNRSTAIFGFANPVIYKDYLIVSYSSGELYAINKLSGEAVWSQDLNLSKAINSNFYLNDIDATPIVKNDVVYAIGNGGLMMAIKIKDGNYLWKRELAGVVDFWAAGEFLFLINNDNNLLCVNKKTGGIKWISQLPNYKKEKKPHTKFIYSGVVMAGDKLLISSFDGSLLIASPPHGKIEKTFEVGKKISHQPIVVNGKIYLQTIGKYTIDLLEIE